MFDLVRRLGQVPWDDLENTLNLGVGMVAVTAPGSADDAVAHLARRGLAAWPLGTVTPDDGTSGPGVVRGSKGVHGGAVRMTGTYRTA